MSMKCVLNNARLLLQYHRKLMNDEQETSTN